MTDICDNMSVGILVIRDNALLMFDRATPPSGVAPPAGHIDTHGSDQQAAWAELYEETGLKADSVEPLWTGWRVNRCRRVTRRPGHQWTVFSATARGDLKPSEAETRNARWVPLGDLPLLVERTMRLVDGEITQREFDASPGLEPVWMGLLSSVGILQCTPRQLRGADVLCAVSP